MEWWGFILGPYGVKWFGTWDTVRALVGVDVGACPVDHLLKRPLSSVYGDDRTLLCGAGEARERLPLLTTPSY